MDDWRNFNGVDDPRFRFDRVRGIDATDDESVIVRGDEGDCVKAQHVIVTASIKNLQHRKIEFAPPLPQWKQKAIDMMNFGAYTKIVLQWKQEDVFWDKSKHFLYYASKLKGYYPVFQNLDHEDFLPGSGILVASMVSDGAVAAYKL